METQKLTVRLPQDDLQFIKQFASDHNVTVTELIRRYFAQLRQQAKPAIDPRLRKITGILPAHVDASKARQDYADYLLEKHQ